MRYDEPHEASSPGGAGAISLIAAAALACGYIGRFGLVSYNSGHRPGPEFRSISFTVEEGRAVMRWQRWNAPGPSPRWLRIQWIANVRQRRAPRLSRWIWEVDAHSLVSNVTGSKVVLLACPIWCLAAPCMIAPLLWLKRRRRQSNRGFPLIHERGRLT